jgi:membrane associated rhomboid family serine protease
MRQITAPVTISLVLINTIVFVAIHAFGLSQNEGQLQHFLYDYGLNPTEFWENQKIWQPVTSMFVHVVLIHFAFNMLAVWSVGTPLELSLGSGRFAFLYFVSGLSGSLFLLIFNADMSQAAVGASGAVFGLLGALAIFYPNSRLLVFFIPMRAITAAAVLAVLSLVFYLFDQLTFIAHMAHLGGLVGGVLYSKFALGLAIGKSRLAPAPGAGLFQRKSSGDPGPGTRTAAPPRVSREAREAEILRLMRGIPDDALQPAPPPENPYRTDKAPDRDTDGSPIQAGENDDRRNPPAQGQPSEPAQQSPLKPVDPAEASESPAEGGPGERRLHYDPETGRFYLK